MADAHVTLTGNLTDDPELKFTPNGNPVANFRLAVTARTKDGDSWRDGDTSFFRQRVAAARRARRRVALPGRPGRGHRPAQQPQLGDPEGDKRSVVEVEADEVGPLPALGHRQARACRNGKGKGDFNDNAPF
jgi:single-strand DNA-binding protein